MGYKKRKSSARRRKQQTRSQRTAEQTNATAHMTNHEEYPFLNQLDVTDYMKKSKVIFLMRGLSGSGKSSIAKAIGIMYRNTEVCSTDDFFLQEDGTYDFNRDLLGIYHGKNQDKAKAACIKNTPTIVIDNTNVKKWEMQPYVQMAREYNYLMVPVMPRTEWAYNPAVLTTKNKHKVSEEIITARLKDLNALHPAFYGWFLNDVITQELKSLAASYFDMCKAEIVHFLKTLGHADKAGETFQNLYSHQGVVHCTARFIGSGEPSENSQAYMDSEIVQNSWLHIFPLRIIGLIITPRTVGARVELSRQQLPLWDNEQDNDTLTSDVQATAAPFKPFLGNKMTTSHQFTPMDGKPAQKAHITLGCAEGVTAVQTGSDLLQLEALEMKYKDVQDRFFELPYGGSLTGEGVRVRYYGPENGYVVYFDKPVSRKSTFNFRY